MKFTFLLLTGFMSLSAMAQERSIDPVAVAILDKMSAVIGDLESCSYSLLVSNDVDEYPFGMVKKHTHSQVYMRGPNKMLIQSRGNDFHKGLWYNGEQLVHYSYTENNYTVVEAPENIIATIDTIHTKYGVEFPAADFFYPTFTDDVINYFEKVVYIGEEWLNNEECFHLKMENEKMAVQIWISDDALNLPMKIVVQYMGKERVPQYEATFNDWVLNPILPEAIFEFTPPPGARQISILAKSGQ